MSRVVSGHANRASVSLAVFVTLSCIIVAGLAVWAYVLMLTPRLENPGVPARKPSPATINYANVARLPRQPDTLAAVTARVVEVPEAPVRQREVESNKATPRHAARRKEQPRPRIDARRDWAFQPFFGGGPFWR